MLLIMILSTATSEEVAGWDIFTEAKSMLGEIEQLTGREREKSLIGEWQENPGSERSQAFFEYAVVKQVNALAALAPSILAQEFV
jgi:SET and MYND domain-containing protein